MKAYSQWLNSLIQDLNYDTLMEEPWSVEFIDAEGNHQVMGNSRNKRRQGIWVASFEDDGSNEFDEIRSHLERASKILKVTRIGRIGRGTEQLPQKYKDVFRIDSFIDDEGEVAVLLDREDNSIEKIQLKEAIDFVDTFEIPVSILGFRGRFETKQYVMLDEGLICTVSQRVKE